MNTPIRLVELEAEPLHGTPVEDLVTGAYVNVYVCAETDELAMSIARRELFSAGWEPSESGEVREIELESLPASGPARGYYEQCLVDGCVVVMHTWRAEH